MLLVAKELGIHTLGRHLAKLRLLLDSVPVGLLVLVVVGVVLGLGHLEKKIACYPQSALEKRYGKKIYLCFMLGEIRESRREIKFILR